MRAPLDGAGPVENSYERFDRAASELAARGGGVISIYYHPTEFVTTEFWDAVNFAKGADRERADWRRPRRRTEADSERCYGILRAYVAHMKNVPGVRFATAREMLQLYGSPAPPSLNRARIAAASGHETDVPAHGAGIAFGRRYAARRCSEWIRRLWMDRRRGLPVRFRGDTIPRAAFERAKADTVSFIRTNQRLPAEVWIGSEKLSIGDFAATLAAYDGTSANAGIRRANLEFEKLLLYRSERLLQLAHPSGGFQRARVARSRPAAGLDAQAGATTVSRGGHPNATVLGHGEEFCRCAAVHADCDRGAAAEPYLEKTVLFERDSGGYMLYRIPGIVVTRKGTILAYAEARKSDRSDWHASDIVLRRSTDGGRTWSVPTVIGAMPEVFPKNPAAVAKKLGLGPGAGVTYNNPVAIADRNGAVHFLFCVEYMRAFYMRSDDDGQTFSKPVEITAAFAGFRPLLGVGGAGDRAGARNPVEKRQAAGAGLALAGKRAAARTGNR